MQDAAGFILMYLVLPLWIAAGLADWWCHRRTGIAITSGLKESLLHWLMYAEIAVALAAVALFEINAVLLAVVFGVFVVHEATVYWDLDYSTLRRDVGPFEQMVHSFLELLPLVSLALLAVMAWPQALALVHAGDDVADWHWRLRQQPLSPVYLATGAAASILFNAIPLMQETWSCWRARRDPRVRRAAARAATRMPRGHASEGPRMEPRLDGEADAKARTPASPGPR